MGFLMCLPFIVHCSLFLELVRVPRLDCDWENDDWNKASNPLAIKPPIKLSALALPNPLAHESRADASLGCSAMLSLLDHRRGALVSQPKIFRRSFLFPRPAIPSFRGLGMPESRCACGVGLVGIPVRLPELM